MSISETQAKILVPFLKHTIECLKLMADLRAKPGRPFRDDPDTFWLSDYAVVVKTSGIIEGTIVMHFYLETALAIGNRVYNKLVNKMHEALDVDDQVIEALVEFANTVVGRAMRDLESTHLAIIFEPPFFMSDMLIADNITEGAQQILTAPIKLEDGKIFYFNYLIKEVRED
jgi:CheY-specific phosphatase CheX